MKEVTFVSVTKDNAVHSAPYWPVPLSRSIIALVAAAVITFAQDHSPRVGLVVFGLFAVLTAIVLVVAALRVHSGAERVIVLLMAVVGLLAGGFALALPAGGLPFFLYLVSVWAAITGFLELYLGLRDRRRAVAARDWMFVGGLTALFAIVVVILPPDLNQQFSGTQGVTGSLTASVIAVGAFGAYAAIVGVYLVIGALSLKWAAKADTAETIEEAPSA
jgi:uncharacterized membrane protein HdeD (DUF308 family)